MNEQKELYTKPNVSNAIIGQLDLIPKSYLFWLYEILLVNSSSLSNFTGQMRKYDMKAKKKQDIWNAMNKILLEEKSLRMVNLWTMDPEGSL